MSRSRLKIGDRVITTDTGERGVVTEVAILMRDAFDHIRTAYVVQLNDGLDVYRYEETLERVGDVF